MNLLAQIEAEISPLHSALPYIDTCAEAVGKEEFDDALSAITRAAETAKEHHDLWVQCLEVRYSLYQKLGRIDDALIDAK